MIGWFRWFYFIADRDSNTANAGSSNDLPSVAHGGFDQVESLSIALSDSDSQECIEDDYAPGYTEVGEHTGESESPIQSEETPIPHNRDVISTRTEVSLPVMPDDLSSIDETHVQHNEVEVNNTSIGMHPAISSGDFNRVVHLKYERDLTDSEKFYLLKHHFVPGISYQFPAQTFGKQSRRFQRNWLTKYNGLVYSQLADGGYCKYCVLFAQYETSNQAFGTLVNQPLTNFKKASNILIYHFSCNGRKSHQIAVEKS